jgi:hypothetical protein
VVVEGEDGSDVVVFDIVGGVFPDGLVTPFFFDSIC